MVVPVSGLRSALDLRHVSLMGILHHQRPGFLSYPSSHTVPYLRSKAFPPNEFPKLYEYRSLADRLERVLLSRAFRRVPELDYTIERNCRSKSAHVLTPSSKVDAITCEPALHAPARPTCATTAYGYGFSMLMTHGGHSIILHLAEEGSVFIS